MSLVQPVRSRDVAAWLRTEHRGTEHDITSVTSLDNAIAGAICFSNRALGSVDVPGTTLIAPGDTDNASGCVIRSDTPRLDFARALLEFERRKLFPVDAPPAEIDDSVSIGSGVVIEDGVQIGAGTRIEHNVVIKKGTVIGRDCLLKSGLVIGDSGFGFERDADGVPVKILHLGGVRIGDRVEIGCLTTVCRGTLADTVIDDDVKIDDHVHIAHNVEIRARSMIVACAEVSGGVIVEPDVWVGPNASVIQKITLGTGSFVGIGANVTKPVEPGVVVAGNPAKPLRRK